MNIKCKKCGTVLAERNFKKQLCDDCQANKQSRIILFPAIIISVLAMSLLVFIAINNYKEHPIYYNEHIVSVIGKYENTIPLYTGKSSGITKQYYLITDEDEHLKVSATVYYKTFIGDYITVVNKIRDNEILETKYKE